MGSNQAESIAKFWRWFVDHRSDFDALLKSDEPFWDMALERLKKIDERLWFVMSEPDDGARDFVVTAEGHIDVFPIAEALVSSAPEIVGWNFVALMPPRGFAFTTVYEGTFFDPQKMWFLPLDMTHRPQDLGLYIGIPGLEAMDKELAHNAALVILDTGLGERSAALDVNYTEVRELPDEPEAAGYIELPELAEYIAWRKRKIVALVN